MHKFTQQKFETDLLTDLCDTVQAHLTEIHSSNEIIRSYLNMLEWGILSELPADQIDHMTAAIAAAHEEIAHTLTVAQAHIYHDSMR